MIYTPKKNVILNLFLSIAFLLVLFISVFVTEFFNLPNVIWQGVFFAEAIAYCEILTKFVLPVYTYSFNSETFEIRRTMGKSSKLVCLIDNYRIAKLYTKKQYKKQEEYNVRSVYNYNANIISPSCMVLVFEYDNYCEAVIFEPNEAMTSSIRAWTENQ